MLAFLSHVHAKMRQSNFGASDAFCAQTDGSECLVFVNVYGIADGAWKEWFLGGGKRGLGALGEGATRS